MGEVLVLGLIAGGIYGLFALGVVLVYRGSGALNFAQGEIGTFSLYAAWWLITEHGAPWLVGAAGAIVLASAIGFGFERLVVRPMVKAGRVTVAVATVGLLSFLLSVELRWFSASPRSVPPPIRGLGVQVAGVYVSPTQWLSLGATVAVALALGLILRRTDFGLGVLAASQDPDAARLMGVPLARVSGFVWATAAALGALAALLVEPTVGVFAPGFASELFLRGLAAAVLGGLTSLPGAFAGGLALGVLEAAARKWLGQSSLPGITVLAVFTVILGSLLLRPRGLFGGLGAAAEAGS